MVAGRYFRHSKVLLVLVRPNSCKRLTKRRMFARAASAALGQRLRTAARALLGHSLVGATPVPLVPSLCVAVLQSMRQSLGRRRVNPLSTESSRAERCAQWRTFWRSFGATRQTSTRHTCYRGDVESTVRFEPVGRPDVFNNPTHACL
jgi:hypothetical protein